MDKYMDIHMNTVALAEQALAQALKNKDMKLYMSLYTQVLNLKLQTITLGGNK